MVTNLKTSRGRPRGFDPQAALAVGQRMFHARGYDAVGLAALTDALGIKPPSFYTAFGSKGAYLERVLDRYTKSVVALDEILVPGRPLHIALADLLDSAARAYTQDPECPGCLVLETLRGNNSEGAALALRVVEEKRATIKAFIAVTRPDRAQDVMDFLSCVMSGMSASAREGFSEARLVKIASAAALNLEALLDATFTDRRSR